MCGGCSICSFCKTFQRNAQPSLEVRISRGLGICPNKSFDEIGAEAEISKTSIPGQECPACQFVIRTLRIVSKERLDFAKQRLYHHYLDV